MPPEPQLGVVPFEEAIRFFRRKGRFKTSRWDDIRGAAHARGFTVAGATKAALLQDIKQAVDDAIANGTTITEFRKQFDRIVEKHGWSYNGKRGWRSRVIFDTNLRSSYAAGRWEQMQRVKKNRPWLIYDTAGDNRVRPEHAAWDGTVLPIDHPWWNTHYPPNDFGCRCNARSASNRQLKSEGLEPTKEAPEIVREDRINRRTGEIYRDQIKGLGTGWNYNVGKEYLRWDPNGKIPDCLPGIFQFAQRSGPCLDPTKDQSTWKNYLRPDLRQVSTELKKVAPPLMPKGNTVEQAHGILLGALGLSRKKPMRTIKTPANETVILDREWSRHFVEKRQDARERYANFILPTLLDPFEIWLTRYKDKMRTRYIGIYTGNRDLLVVVRRNQDGLIVWNIMQANAKKMNSQRVGWLLYGK